MASEKRDDKESTTSKKYNEKQIIYSLLRVLEYMKKADLYSDDSDDSDNESDDEKKNYPSTEDIDPNISKEDLFELINRFNFNSDLRMKFIRIFGYSIPSPKALDKICEFIKKPCELLDETRNSHLVLEVGAGLGTWAKLLKCNGINIIPTSIICNKYYDEKMLKRTWTEIELIDCVEAVKKYKPDVLFVSWGNGILESCLKVFTGSKIIVIGEQKGGCTDALYERPDFEGVKVYVMNENKRSTLTFNYQFHGFVEIPRWECMNDAVFFYEKIKQN